MHLTHVLSDSMSAVTSSPDSLCGTERQLVTSTEYVVNGSQQGPDNPGTAPAKAAVAVHNGGQDDHTATGKGPGRAGPDSNWAGRRGLHWGRGRGRSGGFGWGGRRHAAGTAEYHLVERVFAHFLIGLFLHFCC